MGCPGWEKISTFLSGGTFILTSTLKSETLGVNYPLLLILLIVLQVLLLVSQKLNKVLVVLNSSARLRL